MSGTLALPRRTRRVDGLPTVAAVIGVAGTLALLTIVLGWRGSDLPAQVFRADLVRRNGFVIWNSQWFGGHPTLGYSVLAPPLSALTGPLAVGAVSGIAAAVLFERILRFAFGRAAWIGGIWFAIGTVINLLVGRTTWALGMALGLGAVYALQRKHPTAAVVCAVLCSLSSPLSGFFLVLVAAAWAVGERAQRLGALAIIAGALVPIAGTVLLFPSHGVEPYDLWALIWDVCLGVIVLVTCWRYLPLRAGAVVFTAVAIGSYLVPTAIGGNVSRLGQYVAGPIIACVLVHRQLLWRLFLVAVGTTLFVWQVYPAIDTVVFAPTDPSTHGVYYEPLLGYLATQEGPIGRVEIPFTFRHWETAYVAPHALLARGWERQLDIAYNSIFYEDSLTPNSYEDWLRDNGVKYVALPDAQLDESSIAERELVLGGLPYLNEVWRSTHWRVWKVEGFDGLVEGPASLLEVSPDRLVLAVQGPGDVNVRVRATGHWSVQGDGNECAAATDDGWTVLRNLPVGTVTVSPSLGGTRCPKS